MSTLGRMGLSPTRRQAIFEALESVRATTDMAARREADPVGFVHRYADPQEQELVGLLAAGLAFGNVKTIRHKLADALERLGPRPKDTCGDAAGALARMRGFTHRVFVGDDVARLLVGARAVQRRDGSLGAHFGRAYGASGDLRVALGSMCNAIRDAGGLGVDAGGRRGPAHLLPDPAAGSANKRMMLFLRWMIRPADGVDLGLWSLPTRILVCPVDTHIHKLAKNLGFTKREDTSFRTAQEITASLALFDPEDPVKYDFALCHLGMAQRCPSRRDPLRCRGCGVLPVCRHWTGRDRRASSAVRLLLTSAPR